MGKPRGKMNQTQKAAVRQLEEEFGTNPFYLYIPSKDQGGQMFRPSRSPRYALATRNKSRPRDFSKNPLGLIKRPKGVQMRKGTALSLIKREVLVLRQGMWFLHTTFSRRTNSRIQLLMGGT